MTLIIENVKDEFVPSFKDLAKTSKAKLRVTDSLSPKDAQNLKEIYKRSQKGDLELFEIGEAKQKMDSFLSKYENSI
ncbi:hypothetical protein CCY99_03480 [Helicobacter sp. 16-1353]|uniref:hypothetical protein n=1 Tax=Helicobacter sp. 16-1353 TaxID=2004996 RepID=UPI000DCEF404|nr:hypothetical protein [Helicobacter sp. 16-1353]RAX54425.1 hypothetical protein CCY99_03480 [Helicobacter sp. 16-1353]